MIGTRSENLGSLPFKSMLFSADTRTTPEGRITRVTPVLEQLNEEAA